MLQYGLLDGQSVRLALEVDNESTRRKRGFVNADFAYSVIFI